MATRLKSQLHPETERYLGFATWTADPAVGTLFSAIRDLQPIHSRLRELGLRGRPYENAAADELGELTTVRFDTGRFGTPDGVKTSGTGVVLTIWNHLDDIRSAWIDAQIRGAGLASHDADQARWLDLYTDLQERALPVDAAWVAFQRGAL